MDTWMQASLFGIKRSNRDFAQPYYWGKNQFNSSFPVALACYMREHRIPAIEIAWKNSQETQLREISISDVWRTSKPNHELFFAFESRYEPFKNFVHDEIPAIDLVVCDDNAHNPICPLEIKLTTLPDNTTENLSEDLYGTELVIRSATTRYAAISIAQSCMADKSQKIKNDFKALFPACMGTVRNWDSKQEVMPLASDIIQSLAYILDKHKKFQRPILMQPIWKTVGKSPILADRCLDIFVWTDFAINSLFLKSAIEAAAEGRMTRQLRAAIRLTRFLYEACHGKVYQAPIFDGMTYDWQNDKEFAISGTRSRPLMQSPRLLRPAVRKDEIRNIILGGGQKFLSPERRFDAILYFSSDIFN